MFVVRRLPLFDSSRLFCCSLFVVCCLAFVRCSLFVVCGLLFVACWVSVVGGGWPFVCCCLLLDDCCLLVVCRCLLFGVCRCCRLFVVNWRFYALCCVLIVFVYCSLLFVA